MSALFKIRFINAGDLLSHAIDWATNSLWDHVEIETGMGSFIGAHTDGVQERPADYCTPSRERRYAIPVTYAQAVVIHDFARSQIGTPYNYLDIAGLFVHDRDMTATGREICSMFVFEAAWSAGVKMLNVLPGYTHLITPETLHLSPLLIGRCTYRNMGRVPALPQAAKV